MKGVLFWSIFAAFYILIILIFQASAQEVHDPLNVNQAPPVSPIPASPAFGFNPQPSNFTNGIAGWLQSMNWDVLGLSTPAARQSIDNVYGSFSGNIECQKKSICMVGNSLHNLPGRDLIFLVLSQYVPQDWGILYDIFRISVLYGQNCELFVCQPLPGEQGPPLQAQGPGPVPPTPLPAGPTSTSTSTPPTPAPAAKTTPKKEEFDNEIHKSPNPKIQNKPRQNF